MNSKPFSLNLNDAAKAGIVLVIVAVLGALEQAFKDHGLDFAAFDWGFILNVAVTAAVGYLTKNFLSDNQGVFLGHLRK